MSTTLSVMGCHMDLHENLSELGRSFGADVFDDADGLRAALDDFLDEGAATTGDINLLVDAVRLGAFRWMLTTIDSGADPARAVESAGDLLARDRGSSDVTGSRWAVAALGFAVGRVGDADVRRYRTPSPPPRPPATSPVPPPPTMAPPATTDRPLPPTAPTTLPGGEATVLPGGAPTAMPGTPPQAWSGPAQGGAPPAPPAWSGQPVPGQPGPAPSVPGGPPPAKKNRALVGLLAAGGALVLVAALVLGVLQLTGDDGGTPDAADSSEPSPEPESDDPSGDVSDDTSDGADLEFAAINERYSSLGSRVTTGQSECVAGQALSGQSEALECTFPQGTLRLTTYETLDELTAARTRSVSTDVGGRFAEGLTGVVFSFDTEETAPKLYWDSEVGLQSGELTGSSTDVEVDALATVFASVDSLTEYPEGLTSPELVDFADFWVQPRRCERIQTLSPGELEESLCTARKQIVVYVAQMASRADLVAYRQGRLRDSRRDGMILDPPTWQFGSGTVEGKVADSQAEGDRVLRYWDSDSCGCYMEAYYPTADLDPLVTWWENPKPFG